ncbi:hypothetical protein CGRA01v4_12423 [Colletotrichum graminicola]|uniref:Ecp2 effector protein-like domain-containing protein n=1 Tax=Colletotrichum graminicola (strain M1.001 / M2 / FGSC 10212) TaxID=645133 RepID=E3QSV4_COLGM|nr:uncharacterized protein GLRG_09086 [Colletotrichum graminicola M1.001]EFQ33942.1 hypothetical protein GLRG_09086 [Colletotrichum graminicola M1.001]WDK21134.1 hypothetical protein CGRA01v4_12423 [Colletotrichum graminicola]
MRRFIASTIALAAFAFGRAVPDPGVLDAVALPQGDVTFKASNGSNVVLAAAARLNTIGDVHKLPWPVSKHIKTVTADDDVELCTVRASKQYASVKSPRRDDCQALFDFLKGHPALINPHKLGFDTNPWVETAWVGSCSFQILTHTRDAVLSTGDIASFLGRSLSRPGWTIDGSVSSTEEAADCAVRNSPSGNATVSWRLQQRGPLSLADAKDASLFKASLSGKETARAVEMFQVEYKGPLIVKSLSQIPKNTSAYVFNGTVQQAPDSVESVNLTIAKRYEMYTGGNPEGPFCTPIWLSSDWDQPHTPLKSDCEQLLRFCQQNTAKVVFKERDLNFWAKFAAHESCGLSFKTTKAKIALTNRDMAGFLERAINYEPSTYQGIGVRAKMGVRCGLEKSNQYDGEFRLFYRDPSLPQGQIEQRETGIDAPVMDATEQRDAASEEPDYEALSQVDSAVNWLDFEFTDGDGSNFTAQVNPNTLYTPFNDGKKVAGRLERYETPLGPSKRCNGKTTYMGGAGPDSALVEDCKKLRNFMSVRRFYFRWNDENERGPGQPLAKVDTCHIAWSVARDAVVGNMDIEIVLTNAIEILDNTKGRMRGWGWEWCDLAEQYGEKTWTKWLIFP